MTQSIVDKMMQESEDSIFDRSWRLLGSDEHIFVYTQGGGVYRWYHDYFDTDLYLVDNKVNTQRTEISEDQARVFLFDIKE